MALYSSWFKDRKYVYIWEGTIIPEDAVIPDESVVVGQPSKIIRKLTNKDRNDF